MAEIQWEWRGERKYPVPAQFVGKVIEGIQEADNVEEVSPQRLVDEARPDESPVHSLFEWRDDIAAEAHRREQARQVIRSLGVRVVRLELVPQGEPPKPAYLPVQPMPAFSRSTIETNGERTPGYARTTEIMQRPDARRRMIQEEFNRIKGLLDRTEYIPEFLPLRIAASKVAIEIFSASERTQRTS